MDEVVPDEDEGRTPAEPDKDGDEGDEGDDDGEDGAFEEGSEGRVGRSGTSTAPAGTRWGDEGQSTDHRDATRCDAMRRDPMRSCDPMRRGPLRMVRIANPMRPREPIVPKRQSAPTRKPDRSLSSPLTYTQGIQPFTGP